jgi:hypothetical protein
MRCNISDWIGDEREHMTRLALERLQLENKILFFQKSHHRDSADRSGVDFYIVFIKDMQRTVITCSVLNPHFLREEKNQYPKTKLYLGVDYLESADQIYIRIKKFLEDFRN